MPLLHSIRKAANRVLAPLGFALVRAEKPLPVGELTRVGRYSIAIPAINPLAACYLRYPDSASQLGRLTTLLKSKFSGMAAIDIGANVGDTACIIKSAQEIPILCIEGDDSIFGLLKRNVSQFQDVTLHKLFLGEKTGAIAASMEKTGWNATLKPESTATASKINIVSLDDFLAGQPDVARYKLVKIDTEGFDCSIIRGAKKFIQRVHPVITFEYNRENMEALGEKGLDTLDLLAGLGYSQIFFHDCIGRFFSTTDMSNHDFIRDLHDYADGKNGEIYYFDITVFHQEDCDLARNFAAIERARRTGQPPLSPDLKL